MRGRIAAREQKRPAVPVADYEVLIPQQSPLQNAPLKLAPGNHGKRNHAREPPMQTEHCSACPSIEKRNYQLALDPQQVNSIGAAFEEAWLRFTAAAPAGMDLFAEASIRQLIAVRIIRATRCGELDRDALITLA